MMSWGRYVSTAKLKQTMPSTNSQLTEYPDGFLFLKSSLYDQLR